MLERSEIFPLAFCGCKLLSNQGLSFRRRLGLIGTWNVADLGTKGLLRARTFFPKCLLRACDRGRCLCRCSEYEYASQVQRDLMKSALRQLRQVGAAASKQMIRQVVVAALLSTPVLGTGSVTDALSLPPGAGQMELMLLVIVLACALQGCEPVCESSLGQDRLVPGCGDRGRDRGD